MLQAVAKALSGVVVWPRALVGALLDLPPALLSSRAVRPLEARARAELLALFHDLDAAWASPELRGFWLRLPADALEYLLTHPDLVTACENALFVAVSDWAEMGRGGAAHPVHLAALLGALRLGAVSSTFFTTQVVTRPWVMRALSAGGAHTPLSNAAAATASLGAATWAHANTPPPRPLAAVSAPPYTPPGTGSTLPRGSTQPGAGSTAVPGALAGVGGGAAGAVPAIPGMDATALALVQLSSLYALSQSEGVPEAAKATGGE